MLAGCFGQALATPTAIVDSMFLEHRSGLRITSHQIPNCRLAVYVNCHVVHLSSKGQFFSIVIADPGH